MQEQDLTWAMWLDKCSISNDVITLSPDQAAQPWKPTGADRKAAWNLYTELRSRISTQPLHYRSGDEETALTSLYNLFELTRNNIKEHGPECQHFASFAVYLLNHHLRPLTAKWHKKKVDGKLQNDDDRRDFRKELSFILSIILQFCEIFGRISLGDNYTNESINEDRSKQINDDPGSAIIFDRILIEDNSVAEAMLAKEKEAIRQRRYPDQNDEVTNLVGLACSGGGIRSATFCLGVAQALSKKGILKDIDYLSTVSGGGYFGSFLSSYLNDNSDTVGLNADQLPFSEPGETEAIPIRQIRNNSKYLLKGGLPGRLRIAGLLALGILVNLLALFCLVLITVVVIKFFSMDDELLKHFSDLDTGLIFLSLLLITLLPAVYFFLARYKKLIAGYEKITLWIIIICSVAWTANTYLPGFNSWLIDLIYEQKELFLIFCLSPVALGIAALLAGISSLPGRILLITVGLLGPLLILSGILFTFHWTTVNDLTNLYLVLVTCMIAIWLWLININQVTPHRYYRDRLSETYLLRKNHAYAVDPQLLSELQKNNQYAPYHLINATVNLPGSSKPELRGRDSDFFLFSRNYCGSPLIGYCDTLDLEKKDSHLDLGTAMAVSGAAASAHMGTTTIRGLSFWLSLINIRLGYWLPNPGKLDSITRISAPQPWLLFKELAGSFNENDKYVNLSDGGHIENLGVYELLRRRCKFILAIDGEADPEMNLGSLIKLIRYALVDFGVTIDIDLNDLEKNDMGYSRGHFSMGKITYPDGATGYLLYIKSSLTGNEQEFILDYKRSSPSFPHETTADQFFSEEQFEAYRALGEHIGNDLFHPEIINGTDVIDVSSWISALSSNLLPQSN